MPEKPLEDKLEHHVHEPKPRQFYGMVQYQCGCGLYFTKECYIDYCKKHQIPLKTPKQAQKSLNSD